MRLQEIIDRIDDCAKALDENAEMPYKVRDTAKFLRRTAIRIKRDAELELKVAQTVALHGCAGTVNVGVE